MDNSIKIPPHIRIPRSILNHPTIMGLKDKQFRLFIYLLQNMVFETWEQNDHGQTIQLQPGQYMFTMRELEKQTGLSKSSIERFLKCLTNAQISGQEVRHTKTILTFIHPDICALLKKPSETTSGTTLGQDWDIKEKDKKIRNKNTNVFYTPNSCEFVLANFFLDSIKKINPEAKTPDLQKWSDDFRKMLQIDKRTEDQIRAMIAWMERPGFDNNRFRKKILSPALLRKNWDAMVMCLNIIPIKQIVNAPKITHNRPVHEEYNDYF